LALGGGLPSRQRRDHGQLLAHVGRARGALGGILGEELQDQRLEGRRQLGAVPARRHRRRVDVLADHAHGVVTHEGRPSGDHLVEERSEGVEIGAGVDVARERLLGGHVGGRAEHHALLREARTLGAERQPEVAEPRRPVGIEPDVAGLEVAVDDAARVGVLERGADLVRQAQHLRQLESVLGSRLQPLVESTARHVLAHDVELTLLLAHVVGGDDVGMVAEAPHRLHLPLHAHAGLGVEPLGLDERDRDIAIQPRVAREVDALLGALADEALDPVATAGEARPGARGFR
jgi:hypothetical protein